MAFFGTFFVLLIALAKGFSTQSLLSLPQLSCISVYILRVVLVIVSFNTSHNENKGVIKTFLRSCTSCMYFSGVAYCLLRSLLFFNLFVFFFTYSLFACSHCSFALFVQIVYSNHYCLFFSFLFVCLFVTCPCMSPHTVTGQRTGCTYEEAYKYTDIHTT